MTEREAGSEGPAPSLLGNRLFAMVASQIGLHSCMSGIRMSAPLHALREGSSAGAVGLLLALFALAGALVSLPSGRLADRHGSRIPVLLAVGLGLAAGATATFSQSYLALCLAGLLAGSSANIGIIAMQRGASRLASGPVELRRTFGWIGLAPAVANFVGPLVAGLTIDHFGFQAAFAVLGLLPLCGLIALRWMPQEVSRAAADAADAAVANAQDAVDAKRRNSTWALLASPKMRRLLLVNWSVSASWDVHSFVLPILGHERGFSASVIGLILGVFAAAAGIVRVVVPRLGEHVSETRLLRAALAVAACLFALYPLLHDPWAMAICSMCLGFALGGSQPIVMSVLHQLTPAGRHGESIALRQMTISMSSTAMPLMFGAVGAALGPASLFWVIGAAIGTGSWTAGRMDAPGQVRT